ncbi:MAG: TVP38/TMEM64 family protein [Gemmatimonadales bacterium]
MAQVTRERSYFKLAALAVILIGVTVLVKATPVGEHFTRDKIIEGLNAVRGSLWAPLIFVFAYATATAFALPGSLLTIAGGAVFGFWGGSLLNSLGANLGASAAFGLSRALGRDGVEALVGGRIEGLNKATEQHGFLALLVLRLIPLVPFNALNFGSGLTAMRWRDYVLATVLGILPGTLVYTFFADALVQGSTAAGETARTRMWIAAGLFLALTLVPLIARRLGFGQPRSSS